MTEDELVARKERARAYRDGMHAALLNRDSALLTLREDYTVGALTWDERCKRADAIQAAFEAEAARLKGERDA